MEFEDYYEFEAVANLVINELMRTSYRYNAGKIDKKELSKFLIRLEATIKMFELEPPPFKNKEQHRNYKSILNRLKEAVKDIRKNLA
jgi:hypothetical protein